MIHHAVGNSRKQVMDWVNDIVITHLTRIEQLGAGNIYCQLLDAAYPDEVQLHKVKWGAYLEVDFLHNFKILQTAFQKIGIKKQFNPQKLVKTKYQDNWEFIQWFKGQFQQRIVQNGVYNALAKRNNQKINLLFSDQNNFDLRKTVIKEHKENKENQDKKVNKMIHSTGYKGEESILKSNRSVLGLKVMNISTMEISKSIKKTDSVKKITLSKQNIKPLTSVASESKLKKQKMSVVSKPSQFKPVLVKAVEVIESDEEECF